MPARDIRRAGRLSEPGHSVLHEPQLSQQQMPQQSGHGHAISQHPPPSQPQIGPQQQPATRDEAEPTTGAGVPMAATSSAAWISEVNIE